MGMEHDHVDRLNAVGILTRREIEARILAPVIDALGTRFGRAEVVAVVRDAIAEIAREQGRAMAEARPDRSLATFAEALEPWTRGDALQLRVLEQTSDRFSFDVTRCRYAEMYRGLGIEDLGEALSCQRDGALIEGFSPDVELTRSQTIMRGAAICDFRYRRRVPPHAPSRTDAPAATPTAGSKRR